MIGLCKKCDKYMIMNSKWDKMQIVVYCPECNEEFCRYSEESSGEEVIQSLIKLDIHRELE